MYLLVCAHRAQPESFSSLRSHHHHSIIFQQETSYSCIYRSISICKTVIVISRLALTSPDLSAWILQESSRSVSAWTAVLAASWMFTQTTILIELAPNFSASSLLGEASSLFVFLSLGVFDFDLPFPRPFLPGKSPSPMSSSSSASPVFVVLLPLHTCLKLHWRSGLHWPGTPDWQWFPMSVSPSASVRKSHQPSLISLPVYFCFLRGPLFLPLLVLSTAWNWLLLLQSPLPVIWQAIHLGLKELNCYAQNAEGIGV